MQKKNQTSNGICNKINFIIPAGTNIRVNGTIDGLLYCFHSGID